MDLPERSSSLMMACLMCHGKNPIGEAGLLQISVLGCLLLPIDSVGGEDTVSRLYQICIKVPRLLENTSSS